MNDLDHQVAHDVHMAGSLIDELTRTASYRPTRRLLARDYFAINRMIEQLTAIKDAIEPDVVRAAE